LEGEGALCYKSIGGRPAPSSGDGGREQARREDGKVKRTGIAICLAAFFFALSGCEKSGERERVGSVPTEEEKAEAVRAIEQAIEEEMSGRVRVEISGGKIVIEGRGEGKDFSFAAGGKVTVPRDFPADIPLHPQGVVRLSRKLFKKMIGREAMVILGVPVSFEEAVDFSRRRMEEEGWALAREAMLDDQQFLSFQKGERSVAVNLSPEEKETTISITYVTKE
jgi:hypothetical protein